MNEFNPDHKKTQEEMKPDLSARLRSALGRGEKLVWSGRPIPGQVARAAWPIYLFAIPWTAFALFWESLALSPWFALQGQPDIAGIQKAMAVVFPLFGLPFIAIGFWMLAKPFQAIAEARRTLYALTDRRAIIVCFMDKGEPQLESFGYENMRVECTEKRDGIGSLFFAFNRTTDSEGHPKIERRGFEHIPVVRDVEAKILRAIKFSIEKAAQE